MDDENFNIWLEENGLTGTMVKGRLNAFTTADTRLYIQETDTYIETQVLSRDSAEISMPRSHSSIFLHTCRQLPRIMAPYDRGTLNIIMPYSSMRLLYPEYAELTHNFHIASSTPDKAEKSLAAMVALPGNIANFYREYRQNRAIINIINVFTYGFITLISMIACANVFNTISTNVALRRREFAILRSVGMSHRSFDRMMVYECLLYGTKAIAAGIPVALAVSLWIYRTVNSGYVFVYRPPLDGMAIAVVSVFIVMVITMIYATRQVKKENVIDALKDENL